MVSLLVSHLIHLISVNMDIDMKISISAVHTLKSSGGGGGGGGGELEAYTNAMRMQRKIRLITRPHICQ